MDLNLSPTAWALLRLLHRAQRGGPPPIRGSFVEDEYAELRANGLIERVGRKHAYLTEAGESALCDLYLDSEEEDF